MLIHIKTKATNLLADPLDPKSGTVKIPAGTEIQTEIGINNPHPAYCVGKVCTAFLIQYENEIGYIHTTKIDKFFQENLQKKILKLKTKIKYLSAAINTLQGLINPFNLPD